jgi:predicted nucleotidyltransferase
MESPSKPDQPSAVQALADRIGCSWTHIRACSRAAQEQRQLLADVVGAKRLVPEDTSFVVFGSLARGEWTQSSDIDWALLVDGPADGAHLTMTHDIRQEIRKGGWKEPGRGQLFGGLAVSHELVQESAVMRIPIGTSPSGSSSCSSHEPRSPTTQSGRESSAPC